MSRKDINSFWAKSFIAAYPFTRGLPSSICPYGRRLFFCFLTIPLRLPFHFYHYNKLNKNKEYMEYHARPSGWSGFALQMFFTIFGYAALFAIGMGAHQSFIDLFGKDVDIWMKIIGIPIMMIVLSILAIFIIAVCLMVVRFFTDAFHHLKSKQQNLTHNVQTVANKEESFLFIMREWYRAVHDKVCPPIEWYNRHTEGE